MTDTTTTTRTPLQELRDAAKTLRCDHRFPIQPPHGSLARPGACSKCGVHVLNALEVPDALIEPLAEWLETEAHMIASQGLSPEGQSFHALKVARAIKGEVR